MSPVIADALADLDQLIAEAPWPALRTRLASIRVRLARAGRDVMVDPADLRALLEPGTVSQAQAIGATARLQTALDAS